MTTGESNPASSCAAGRGWRIAGWSIVVLVLAIATLAGVSCRQWAFEATQAGRFRPDIRRNYNFGISVLEQGYLNIYENQLRDDPPLEQKLDYPPLRLATFTAWVAWMRWTHPEAGAWQADFEFNAFLMWHNTILAWLGALAALLIVRYWLGESARADLPPPGEAEIAALRAGVGMVPAVLAFLALWFDPGMLIIGHGWPSPNMWAVPYYLWTVYLCLRDRWFIAGLVMGIGAMLQGQQLFVVAVFVLWPLFAGRPTRALRWVAGFALAFALVASGWLLTLRPDANLPGRVVNSPAVAWVVGSAAVLALVGLRTTLRGKLHWAWFLIPAAAALAILGWPAKRAGVGTAAVAIPAAALVAAFWFCRWSFKRYLLALTVAVCLFACVGVFGSSSAWWKIGFLYGAERFPVMAFDTTNNLAAILQSYFGWTDINETAVLIRQSSVAGWPAKALPISIKQLLFAIFVIGLVAASAAIARQWRRRDRNLLVALVLPWVLFYTIPAQISPRYPVFISGVGAICLGRSLGMWLLVLMFSALTVEQAGLSMMKCNWIRNGPEVDALFNRDVRHLLEQFNPGVSWAVVLAAGVFLYASFSRSRWAARHKAPQPIATADGIHKSAT